MPGSLPEINKEIGVTALYVARYNGDPYQKNLAHPTLEAGRRRNALTAVRRPPSGLHPRVVRSVGTLRGWSQPPAAIVTVVCTEARRQGIQYTKRILPWFVIPECNIRLDLALKLLKSAGTRRAGAGLRAGRCGGREPLRTDHTAIQRHLRWVQQLVAATVVEAAQLLAQVAAFASGGTSNTCRARSRPPARRRAIARSPAAAPVHRVHGDDVGRLALAQGRTRMFGLTSRDQSSSSGAAGTRVMRRPPRAPPTSNRSYTQYS